MMAQDHAPDRPGLLLGFGAYLLWGVLPLYFALLRHLLPTEIVAHRVVWSLVFLVLLVTALGKWAAVRLALRTPRVLPLLLTTATLIAANWLVYIWAVLNGHVLEGSLGYYLNPLVNVLLGVVLLKERLTRPQVVAVVLASIGVAVLAAGAGKGLWISLALAGTFALYGYLRKVAPVDALEGLSIETALLAPVAVGWLLWLGHSGSGGFPGDAATNLFAILSGAVTAVPLLLFAAAARRLPYSVLGMLQYVAPSLQFVLAITVFGEALTVPHIICFALIWAGLALYVASSVRRPRPVPAE